MKTDDVFADDQRLRQLQQVSVSINVACWLAGFLYNTSVVSIMKERGLKRFRVCLYIHSVLTE